MSRLVSTVVVVLLLGGTAAAFAVTEGLKLERSPITRTSVDKVVSPTCDCGRPAEIGFHLRKRDRVTLTVVDDGGDVVRTLLSGPRRGNVQAAWNGRGDDGAPLPQGTYRPRVHLADQHRTIVLPNPIRVDTVAPQVTFVGVEPRAFSPDRDGRRELVYARYRLSEPGHPSLLVDGRVAVGPAHFPQTSGQLQWFGKVGRHSLPAGLYRLSLIARDLAGNLSRQTPVRTVRIRYVVLRRHVVRTRTGARFGVGFSTDARTVRWQLNGRSAVAPRGTLRLRAPARPGRYRLYVSANGHADSALVVVGKPR